MRLLPAAKYIRHRDDLRHPGFLAVGVLGLIACSAPVLAQNNYIETEPNDTPQTAMGVRGPATLMGAMSDGDQDAYLWTVSDEDAGRHWTLELQGIPGLLTIMEIVRLEYDDAGQLSSADTLMKIGSRDGSRPAVVEGLAFEPGEYLLGLARSGGTAAYRPATASLSFGDSGSGANGAAPATEPGAYRVLLNSGATFGSSSHEPHAGRESARPARFNREISSFLEDEKSTWYRLDIAEAQSTSRWDIEIRVPVGLSVNAVLIDAEGTQLAAARSADNGLLTFVDISMAAGRYFLEVTPVLQTGAPPGFIQLLNVIEVGQRVEGSEAEPNNRWSLANRAEGDACCTGRIGERRDLDLFAFTIDEARADSLQQIVLATAPEYTMRLCLRDGNGVQIQCREGKGGATLGNLGLAPGEYGIGVRGIGATVDNDYVLRIGTAGALQAGQETEPNDIQAYAIGTPAAHRIRGSFDVRKDVDFYKFVLTDEPQLWRVQAIGDNIASVAYYDKIGGQQQRLNSAPGQHRVTLENLFLLPGTHYFSVTGRDAGDYTLLARALGPPDPNAEREPNDDLTRMLPLRIGQTRTGILSDPVDTDRYRFHLNGWDHVILTATPPVDGKLGAVLEFAGARYGEAKRIDGPIVLEGRLPPGDYRLALSAREPSAAEYRLSLERSENLGCPGDCEPNNSLVFANPLTPGSTFQGHAGDWYDQDWYALPVDDAPQAVSFRFESEAGPALRIYDDSLDEIRFQLDRSTSTYTGTLPAKRRTYAVADRAAIAYTLTMLAGDESTPALPDLPVELKVDLDVNAVAPYELVGQSLDAGVLLRNTGSTTLDLELHWDASDARWQFLPDVERVTLLPESEQTVSLQIVAPPDVPADKSVRIVVRARAEDGRMASAFADVSVAPDALPAGPLRAWDIPKSLRGGFNVARLDFGASATTAPNPSNKFDKPLKELFDGRSVMGGGISFANRESPQVVTVELAGETAVPVAGFALNPLYRQFTQRSPRDVEFQLSEDGEVFTSVLKGAMSTIGNDQFFVLDAPVSARYARLIMDSNWYGQVGGPLTLGEWKVIAEPGFDPFGGEGVDLTDVSFGGHVVWSNQALGGAWNISILTDRQETPVANVPPNEPIEWVVGFHHDRAARIGRIVFGAARGANVDLNAVEVSASLESPLGPWQIVAGWSRAADGDTLVLDVPVWARFLRFTAPPAEDRRLIDFPDTLRVIEAPTDTNYRSVLSEWGFNSRSAYYESTLPVPRRPQSSQRGNESRNTAAVLLTNQVETGRVRLKEQSQWYRPQLPEGDNTVTLTVTGDPTVRAELELTDPDGEPILLRKQESRSTPSRHIFEATLDPGQATFLEVREPPRNVIFLWDTSPSMGAYLPMVYNSLQAYAEDLVPGYDMANLLPFGASKPLLSSWYGEPYLVQLVLNDHRGSYGSSAAEFSQTQAARALATRPGTKAIVMITDAHTTAYDEMWDALDDARPRIFTMHVGTADYSQDLMQDWASVNGGHYAYVTDEGEMDVAFERAVAMLRQPVDYALTMTTEYREAPGPGYLRVVSGTEGVVAGPPVVELILDASGSMLQRMEGRRRIEIAKEVLTTAIRERIPAGTPTALRVFGHRTPNACETSLEIPLEPLDPDVAVQTISNIQAKNLARTPIGASLAAVRRDLGGADRSALIVLVTDGEETCDGDPAAEIEKLRTSGLDISVNIVGFAIDDQALADEFEAWAGAGGGHYFAAGNSDGLADAVAQALATTFAVYDTSGSVVAEGTVNGNPIEVPEGRYHVVVDSTPARTFDDVEIRGDADIKLELSP